MFHFAITYFCHVNVCAESPHKIITIRTNVKPETLREDVYGFGHIFASKADLNPVQGYRAGLEKRYDKGGETYAAKVWIRF